MVKKASKFREADLYGYQGEYQVRLSTDIWERLKEEERPPAYRLGLPTLDALVGGVEPGELIIVSGWTGHGKTSLLRTITRHLVQQEIMPLWFQFEETYRQFLSKFAASDGITAQELPVFALPERLKGHSVEWLEERIVEGKLKWGIKAVMIDHLHRLLDHQLRKKATLEAGSNNISTFVGANVMAIKEIAIRQDVPIFLIAHTLKPPSGNTREWKHIGLGSVRDSSFIEQEADLVLYVYRSPDTDGRGNVKVAKDRKNGRAGAVIRLVHNAQTKTFEEAA